MSKKTPEFKVMAMRPSDHKEIRILAAKACKTLTAFIPDLIKAYKEKK